MSKHLPNPACVVAVALFALATMACLFAVAVPSASAAVNPDAQQLFKTSLSQPKVHVVGPGLRVEIETKKQRLYIKSSDGQEVIDRRKYLVKRPKKRCFKKIKTAPGFFKSYRRGFIDAFAESVAEDLTELSHDGSHYEFADSEGSVFTWNYSWENWSLTSITHVEQRVKFSYKKGVKFPRIKICR